MTLSQMTNTRDTKFKKIKPSDQLFLSQMTLSQMALSQVTIYPFTTVARMRNADFGTETQTN